MKMVTIRSSGTPTKSCDNKRRRLHLSKWHVACPFLLQEDQLSEIESTENRVFKAKDLVEVQDGSVVSRTLLKQANGTITVFAFHTGGGLSEHSAPFDVLVQVLEGELELTLSSVPYRLSDGESLIMKANEPHALKAIRPLKLLLVMMRAT